MIECDSSQLMGTHFMQTLEALGRLASASKSASARWKLVSVYGGKRVGSASITKKGNDDENEDEK